MNSTDQDSIHSIMKMRAPLTKKLTVTIGNGTSILSSTMLVTKLRGRHHSFACYEWIWTTTHGNHSWI